MRLHAPARAWRRAARDAHDPPAATIVAKQVDFTTLPADTRALHFLDETFENRDFLQNMVPIWILQTMTG